MKINWTLLVSERVKDSRKKQQQQKTEKEKTRFWWCLLKFGKIILQSDLFIIRTIFKLRTRNSKKFFFVIIFRTLSRLEYWISHLVKYVAFLSDEIWLVDDESSIFLPENKKNQVSKIDYRGFIESSYLSLNAIEFVAKFVIIWIGYLMICQWQADEWRSSVSCSLGYYLERKTNGLMAQFYHHFSCLLLMYIWMIFLF